MGEEDGARLFVAGSSSAVPRPGRANSGYLLRDAGHAIAVDLGNGAFARLRTAIDPARLDAVIVSHMHADHFFDLIPLRYALKYEHPCGHALPVYLPPGGIAALRAVSSPLKDAGDFFAGIMDVREYDPARDLRIGECTVRFARTVHYIPAFAMRFELAGGALGFSADTAPSDVVRELIAGVDLFLCEAALGAAGREKGLRGHLNAREAGQLAAQAHVRQLVLTHYGAGAEPAQLCAAAALEYTGPITVADDEIELPLQPGTGSAR